MGNLTSFLFAEPSFLEGAARALDIGDTLTEYNESMSAGQADELALRNDWRAIGEDFRQVLSEVEHDIEMER